MYSDVPRLYVKMTEKDFSTQLNRWREMTWSGSDRFLVNNVFSPWRSTIAASLSLKRTKGSARAPVGRYDVRRRSGTGGLPDAVHARVYMEAATEWAELGVPGWENGCGSHPQHHRRVWFKFVDLVTRIGSARLQCTEFRVFDHFYTDIGFEKYNFHQYFHNITSVIFVRWASLCIILIGFFFFSILYIFSINSISIV